MDLNYEDYKCPAAELRFRSPNEDEIEGLERMKKTSAVVLLPLVLMVVFVGFFIYKISTMFPSNAGEAGIMFKIIPIFMAAVLIIGVTSTALKVIKTMKSNVEDYGVCETEIVDVHVRRHKNGSTRYVDVWSEADRKYVTGIRFLGANPYVGDTVNIVKGMGGPNSYVAVAPGNWRLSGSN